MSDTRRSRSDRLAERADRMRRQAWPDSDPARPGETRTYKVVDRAAGIRANDPPVIIEVTVSAACPHLVDGQPCGATRARGHDRTVPDHLSDTEIVISIWRRTCQHLDLHSDLIEEARTLQTLTA